METMKSNESLISRIRSLERENTALVQRLGAMEEKFNKSEEILYQITNTMQETLSVINLEGDFLYANDNAAYNMADSKGHSIVSRNIKEFLPEDYAENLIKLYRDVYKSGKAYTQEILIKLNKGDTWFFNTLKPLNYGLQKVPAVLSVSLDITERKKMEITLRESEDKFKYVFDNSMIGISIALPSGEFYANNAFCSMLGYSREEVKNIPWQKVTHPDDVDLSSKVIDSIVSGERDSVKFLKRYIHKNGSVVWANVATTLRRDGEGKPLYFIASINDITEWKKNREQNRLYYQQIESIFRSAPAGIGMVSNRIIIKVNKRVEELSGYSEEELIGKNSRIFYPSDEEYEYVGREKYRQIALHGTGTVESRWKRKDGTLIDVLMSSSQIDLNDYSKGFTFTVLDISESKKDKAALLHSERKYRTMMEAFEDPTYICSPDMHIEYMNPAMVKWLGKDSTGQLCHKAIWGSGVKCSWCIHEKVIAGKVTAIEFQNPATERYYHVSSVPIHNDQGGFSTLTSYRDVTEVRHLQLKLQQAQKMEAIGSLAGGIAHDFNNILFPIVGFAEMLTEDLPPGSPERANAQEILCAGKRAVDIVKQILAFSRQQDNMLIPTKVEQVIKEVIKLSRATIPMNIEILNDLQQDCADVMANSTQLHQIGMNLIINAYHAVEEKGGQIMVQVREVVLGSVETAEMTIQPGRYVRLSVADNGVGIPSENLKRIFDPYFTTKMTGKGTGLGLAVVYGIVREHRGDIRVDSKIGKGTTFEIYFPLIERKQVSSTSAVQCRDWSETERIERILLVDDDTVIADLGKQMLERVGYTVNAFTSSADALEAFENSPDAYDLVITDMSMPGMTGDLLAGKLLDIRPGLPIIICTGYSERMDREIVNKTGIRGLLMKPVSMSSLLKEVRRVLDCEE
ncbi:hybrid sensor histidine kinase/response regulator [Desulfamplus magnetovallimortis]|nr:PAS domain S-box protein [Desulfamplus magnetovallimortis]